MSAYVVQLEGYMYHTCAALLPGEVKCFGRSSLGRLGCGWGCPNRLAPNETVALSGLVTRLSTGSYADHTLVVHPNGSFQAWGRGDYGQCGYGDPNTVGDNETPASVGDVNFPDRVSCAVPLPDTLTATEASGAATEASMTHTEVSDAATQRSDTATVTGPTLTGSKTGTRTRITLTQPSDTATQPSVTATQPSDTATQPSDTATQESETATQPSATETLASVTRTLASESETQETLSGTEASLSATAAMEASSSSEPGGSNTVLVVVVVVMIVVGVLLLVGCGATGAFVVQRRHKNAAWMEREVEDAVDAAATGQSASSSEEVEVKTEAEAFELAPLKKRGHKEIGDGRYNLLSKVTRSEAAAIAKATGLVVPFAPGARKTKHVIGRGNFGSIKIGQRVEDGEFVAVKKVKGEVSVAESKAEAQMQLAAAGANVLPIYNTVELRDSETEEPLLFHFMPLAGLGNGRHVQALLQACGDADLCERALIFVAKDLLLALRTMHAQGVFHLDVKPENVVWKIDGTGYVTDFGCARKSRDGQVPGDAIGDHRYFAPERFAAAFEPEGSTFDGAAADVWAAGVMLLEMVSGKEVLEVLGLPADTQARFERGGSPAFLEKQLAKVPELQRKSSPGSLLGVLRAMLVPRVEERVSVAAALDSACFGVVDAKEEWIAREERRERGAVFHALQNPTSAKKAAAAHYSRVREKTGAADRSNSSSSSSSIEDEEEEEEGEVEEEEAYQKTPAVVMPYVHAAHKQYYVKEKVL